MFQSNSPFRQQGQYSTPGPFNPQPQQPQAQPAPAQSTSTFHPQPSSNQHPLAGPQFGAGNSWNGSPSHNQQQQHAYQPQFGYGGPGASYGAAQSGGAQQYSHAQQNTNSQNTSSQGQAKRNYLPGYLSGAMGQSEGTPPQAIDTSAWDSPSSRANLSGGSPINRFNQSLFGGSTRDAATPSRSPKRANFRESRNDMMEDDAPPVASLGDGASGHDTFSFEPAPEPTKRPSFRSTPSSQTIPLPSTSSQPSSSSDTAASGPGYAVHLFGFPSSALSLVLEHFTPLGTVVSTVPSPDGGNWVTLTYAEPWAAMRASRKNGQVLGGVLMIGVALVDEQAVLAAGSSSSSSTENASGNAIGQSGQQTPSGGSATPGGGGGGRPSTPSSMALGRPVAIAQGSAFKPMQQAVTPRRLNVGSQGVAGLFADQSQNGAKAEEAPKGVLGRVADMVFGF